MIYRKNVFTKDFSNPRYHISFCQSRVDMYLGQGIKNPTAEGLQGKVVLI